MALGACGSRGNSHSTCRALQQDQQPCQCVGEAGGQGYGTALQPDSEYISQLLWAQAPARQRQ